MNLKATKKLRKELRKMILSGNAGEETKQYLAQLLADNNKFAADNKFLRAQVVLFSGENKRLRALVIKKDGKNG